MANQAHVKVVRAGTDAINAWRLDNPDTILQLSNADLYAVHIDGADLSGAICAGACFVNASIIGTNFSNANLSRADLYCSNMSAANFSGANLSHINSDDAPLSSCTLKGASFSHANLCLARLTATDLHSVNFSHAYLMRAQLKRANLTGASMAYASLAYAHIEGADMSDTELYRATFQFTEFGDGFVRNGLLLKRAPLRFTITPYLRIEEWGRGTVKITSYEEQSTEWDRDIIPIVELQSRIDNGYLHEYEKFQAGLQMLAYICLKYQ